MDEIFSYSDYKKYVHAWIKNKPNGGHGQYRKIAHYLRIATVTISQIFNGDRDLPLEQAPKLAQFLKLGRLEREYLIKLVMHARAGNQELREFVEDELKEIRDKANSLKNRVPSQIELENEDLAKFHSAWVYSATRLLTASAEFQNISQIAEALHLEQKTIEAVVEFLLKCGLCRVENGRLTMGPSRTHLPDDSPYIISRQLSWRTKAMEHMHKKLKTDLFYTAPMIIAEQDCEAVRKDILKFIDRVNGIAAPSGNEKLVCLNVDWVKLV